VGTARLPFCVPIGNIGVKRRIEGLAMKREPQMAEDQPRDGKKPRAAERVSETADRLFYRRGIRAVGVEEIVAEAGVTKPSLYRTFGSKDELVTTCLQGRFAKVMADMDTLEAAHGDDPLALVRALVAHVAAELASEEFRGCAVTNAAVEFPEEDHPTRLLALTLKGRMRARLLAIVSQLPTTRSEELTDALILLFEGARAIRHTSCSRGPACALVAAADAVLAGFLPGAAMSDPAVPAKD
jgi:AcrR family transcriptional regulator